MTLDNHTANKHYFEVQIVTYPRVSPWLTRLLNPQSICKPALVQQVQDTCRHSTNMMDMK